MFIEIAFLLAFFRAKGDKTFWQFMDKCINDLLKKES